MGTGVVVDTRRATPGTKHLGQRPLLEIADASDWGWWVVAVALVIVSQPVLWARATGGVSGLHHPDILGSVLVTVVALPLGLAPRRPLSALTLSGAALVTAYTLGYPPTPAELATLALVAYAVATTKLAYSLGASGLLAVAVGVPSTMGSERHTLAGNPGALFVIPLTALLGLLLRAHSRHAAEASRCQELAARERARADAERAAAAERLRIARELHDAVGHAVTLIGLRSEAATRLLRSDPTRAQSLLGDVGSAVRDAMHELHQLVGVLRDTAPPPRQDPLDQVVAQFGGAGLEVVLDQDPLASGIGEGTDQLVADIVAEGLANVVRHAQAHKAVVRLRSDRGRLMVEVCDDGRGPLPGATMGFGLIGAAERVQEAGGQLEFNAGPAGGGLLTAVVPLRSP